MLIRELSCKTDASVRSLRYYETKKMLVSKRLENGYREYDDTAIERVKTIQLYLSLGLNTDAIAQIIECPTTTQNRPHNNKRQSYKIYWIWLNSIELIV